MRRACHEGFQRRQPTPVAGSTVDKPCTRKNFVGDAEETRRGGGGIRGLLGVANQYAKPEEESRKITTKQHRPLVFDKKKLHDEKKKKKRFGKASFSKSHR